MNVPTIYHLQSHASPDNSRAANHSVGVGIITVCKDAYRQKDNRPKPKEPYVMFVLNTLILYSDALRYGPVAFSVGAADQGISFIVTADLFRLGVKMNDAADAGGNVAQM